MTTPAAITEALAAYQPQIAADYAVLTRRAFAAMIANLGPELKGVGNSWDYAKMWSTWIAAYARRTPARTYVIDEDRLAHGAAAYAEQAVAEWTGKIAAKLGEIDAAQVQRLSGTSFEITGTRQGRQIRIEQQSIVNVSRNGRPYNQFPARIYVDGHFTSAAAYSRSFK